MWEGSLIDDNQMTIVNTDIEVTYELLKNGTVAQKKVIDTKTNAFGLYKFDPKTDGMLMMGDSCVTSGPNDTLCFRMTIKWGNGNSIDVPAEKIKKVPQSENANFSEQAGSALTADFAVNAETALSALNSKNADFAEVAEMANSINSGVDDGDLTSGDFLLLGQSISMERGLTVRKPGGIVIPRNRGPIVFMPMPGDTSPPSACSIMDVADQLPAVYYPSNRIQDVNYGDVISNPSAYHKTGNILRDEQGLFSRVVPVPGTGTLNVIPVPQTAQPFFFRSGTNLRLRGRGVESYTFPGIITIENNSSVTFGFTDGVNVYSGMFGGVVCASDFFSTSDVALKSNISSLGSVMGQVMSLNPASYTYEGSDFFQSSAGNRDIGFIAQELEEVFPDLVREVNVGSLTPGDSEELVKVVDYDGLIPILTRAMQEQQEQIEEQARQIAELKALVEELAKK